MTYLKIWTNFRDVIDNLEYDEIGRLFVMMLTYASTGEEPKKFDGNERFLWPVAKQQIDLAAITNEKLRQNGMRGGRPKAKETKENQTEPEETKWNQTKAYKEKKSNEKESNEYYDDDNAREGDGFASVQELRQIRDDQNRMLDAAEQAGFTKSDAVRSKLVSLFADHGLQKMLDGIESCVTHGAPTIAYLSAVLDGKPKPRQPTTKAPAQYECQRDYSKADEEAVAAMLKRFDKNRDAI